MIKKIVSRWFHKYLKVFEKKRVRKDADEKDMRSCHKSQRKFCSKKEEDISVVKNRKRRS